MVDFINTTIMFLELLTELISKTTLLIKTTKSLAPSLGTRINTGRISSFGETVSSFV